MYTMFRFYSYRFSIRPQLSPLFYECKLFQQYIIDAYLKIDSRRFKYLAANQTELRVENYCAPINHCNRFVDREHVENVWLTSDTFFQFYKNGSRYIHQLHQYALA